MNYNKIPEDILRDLISRGLNQSDIEQATASQLFSEYCEWQGLIGYSRKLERAIDALRDAEQDHETLLNDGRQLAEDLLAGFDVSQADKWCDEYGSRVVSRLVSALESKGGSHERP